MEETVLIGRKRELTRISREEWEKFVFKIAQRYESAITFMTEEHHLTHNFVVREFPRVGKPMQVEFIAQELKLPHDRVMTILDELEEHFTFLVRNKQGAVEWAYPVTVADTPHHIIFSTGERINGA